MIYIYIIKLESDKYYIGKTSNDPELRYNEHQSGKSAEWTIKYKLVKLIKTIESEDSYDENK